MKYYIINEEVVNGLIGYLVEQKYKDVAKPIQVLSHLEPMTINKELDKKSTKPEQSEMIE